MEILGYSERGLINSLLYAIRYRPNATELMRSMLDLARWPQRAEASSVLFERCTLVMIEQSFSDFGDADAVLLFGDHGGSAVFLEAKRGRYFRISEEWDEFSTACQNRAGCPAITSNLFCQLYFKQRMVQAIADPASFGDINLGLRFDAPLARQKEDRKIGNNLVVLHAMRKLEPHARDPYFLMLVPESAGVVERWWRETLCLSGQVLHGCDFSRWGFLSIRDIERFCTAAGLDETISVLRFNEGQLY